MSDQKPRHRRTAPPAEPDAQVGVMPAPVAPVHLDAAESDARPRRTRCVLNGCEEPPEWRGLCAAHRQTHRGLAVEEAS